LAQLETLCAQTTRPNRVLDLDGNGSYVELPADAFTNLTEVTVEGWVKWESFRENSRFFDFTLTGYELDAQNRGTSSTLWVEKITGGSLGWDQVQVPGFLSPDRWTHVAAVSARGGIKLFADGVLIATDASRAPALDTRNVERRNYLGRSNWRISNPGDADFHGQMDEVRVWKVARTEAQIRATMFKKLDGREPGLAGLWNFDDGTANDATPGVHHGKLVGAARITAALPADGVLASRSTCRPLADLAKGPR